MAAHAISPNKKFEISAIDANPIPASTVTQLHKNICG